ncbi:MAG: trigger factor [Phycisphaerae bacterium]|nr:trigger factor [Phycisphaerae bacterium]NIW70367.1 trigger factor [candidate division KSB1 bacterium]NIP56396.1 trigger factor [Phycisphaerae bacterium]NIS54845.1 trigger factor [Phycisphaerae bacterium]NIU12398.1 trigger factor [Phycisphaerae bacterium]
MAEDEQATETEKTEEQQDEIKNTVTIEEAGPCRKKVIIEVPEEKIKNATEEQYDTLRKEAIVPGFRKGRAPRRLLEKRFGKETSEQIKLKLIADASDSAIKDNKLDALRDPDIDFEKRPLCSLDLDFQADLDQSTISEKMRQEFEKNNAPLSKNAAVSVEQSETEWLVTDEGKSYPIKKELDKLNIYESIDLPAEGPLKFDFEVEVRPEFDLPQLEGIPVTRTKLEVTDEQIDREVEQMQKMSGLWTPRTDGAAEEDDQIIADAVLKVANVEAEEKLDNVNIYVRSNGFVGAVPVEKLDKLLVGAKVGDTKEKTVEVPKTFFREEYRGKKVDIQITVNDIKYLKPAALDENFLKKLQVDDENQLRERIQDSLQGRLEQQVRTEMTEQIYKYLLDNTDFDLPLNIVAEQSISLLQRQYSNLLMRGMAREQIEEHMEQLQAGSAQRAQEQLKTFFIMDKIADKLEIEVTEEEINGHIAQLAIQQGQRPERMREQMLRDGSLAQFKLQVREQMCIAKLLESAKITEKKAEKKSKKAQKKSEKKTTKKKAKKEGATGKKTAKKPKKTTKKQ